MSLREQIINAVADSVYEHKALAVAALKVLSHLDIRESTLIPTAGVTARSLIVNPEWFTRLSDREQVGLIYHEALHLLLRHGQRGRGKARDLWNVAADIEINELLVRCGFALPEGGQRAAMYKLPSGLLAEEYYERLRAGAQQSAQAGDQDGGESGGQSGDASSGQAGDHQAGQTSGQRKSRQRGQASGQERARAGGGQDVHGKAVHEGNPALDDMDGEAIAEEIYRRIASELAGKLAGSGSIDVLRVLERAVAMRVRWEDLLREHLRQAVGGRMKRTFMRPSARTQVCWPVVRARVLWEDARVLVLVDQSASMDDELVQRALAEVDRIAAVATVYYSAVDTEPTPPQRVYKSVDKARHKRGGTEFDSAFRLVEEVQADVLVVITDGYVHWPPEPNVPVIVVLVADGTAPRYQRCTVVRAEK